MKYSIIRTRLGYFGIVYSDKGLRGTVLPKKDKTDLMLAVADNFAGELLVQARAPAELEKIFTNYFSGRNVDFSSVRLDVQGTDFEKDVWAACMTIPHGEVRSYSWIAEKIKNENASRAVGNALGKNPIAPIVPCHRVIASEGLGGFSSGLEMKRILLSLER